jgi:serine/threonine protein kinase
MVISKELVSHPNSYSLSLSLIGFQSNVLINNDGDACLIDFGLSRILDARGFTTKTATSTYRYAAPELYWVEEAVEQMPVEERGELGFPRFTRESDVWAFSMLVIEVRT